MTCPLCTLNSLPSSREAESKLRVWLPGPPCSANFNPLLLPRETVEPFTRHFFQLTTANRAPRLYSLQFPFSSIHSVLQWSFFFPSFVFCFCLVSHHTFFRAVTILFPHTSSPPSYFYSYSWIMSMGAPSALSSWPFPFVPSFFLSLSLASLYAALSHLLTLQVCAHLSHIDIR